MKERTPKVFDQITAIASGVREDGLEHIELIVNEVGKAAVRSRDTFATWPTNITNEQQIADRNTSYCEEVYFLLKPYFYLLLHSSPELHSTDKKDIACAEELYDDTHRLNCAWHLEQTACLVFSLGKDAPDIYTNTWCTNFWRT